MTAPTTPSTIPSRSGPGIHLPCLNCRQGRFFHELEIEGELTYTCPQCGHQITGDEVRGYLHPAVLQSPALVLAGPFKSPQVARTDEPGLAAVIRAQVRLPDGRWRILAMLENAGRGLAHESASYSVDLVDARGVLQGSEAGLCSLILPGQIVPIVIERRGAGPFRARLAVQPGATIFTGTVPVPRANVTRVSLAAVSVRVENPYSCELSDLKVTVVQMLPGGDVFFASRGGVDLAPSAVSEVELKTAGSRLATDAEAFVTFTPLTLRHLTAS